MFGLKALPRTCPRCQHDLSMDDVECPQCGDDGTFRFPIVASLGIALFVGGAITYHFYPEIGAMLIRLSGYGEPLAHP